MDFRTKKLKGLEDIKISSIEKIIVNWATPLEYLVISTLISFEKEFYERHLKKEYFEGEDTYFKEGTWSGLVNSKIDDYRRLVKSNKERTNDKINLLYEGSICGKVMKVTYNLFNKK